MKAHILDASVTPDGTTRVTYEVREGRAVIATHTQSFPAEIERVPERRTRTVPKRTATGDVVFERAGDGPPAPVLLEEDYDEMVETGRLVPVSAETIREAIVNYARDVVALVGAEPPVSAGESFKV